MKSLDAPTLTALASPSVRLVMFIQFDYTVSGTTYTARLCTAGHDIAWNSQTWTGGGQVLSVEPVRESGAVEAIGLQVVISGVPSDKLALVMTAQVVGRPAKVYVGCYSEAGALVSTPWLEYEGRADNLEIEDGRETSTITLSIESRLVSLLQAEGRLWNQAEQQKLYPTDTGFNYIVTAAERTMSFGYVQ